MMFSWRGCPSRRRKILGRRPWSGRKFLAIHLQWDDLGWLRSLTKLPMLLKGIQHPDDVRKARDYGIDGIYAGALRFGRAQRFRRRQGVGVGSYRSRGGSPVGICPRCRWCRRCRVAIAFAASRIGLTHGRRRLPEHRGPPGSGRTTHLIIREAHPAAGWRALCERCWRARRDHPGRSRSRRMPSDTGGRGRTIAHAESPRGFVGMEYVPKLQRWPGPVAR